ncbi:tetratricopeptide repeat protein [Staphylospora marina]|uniref:tetratricopeptide repeat protein n=1 Tax=Staphylospora marina TaxID=2490858 RepID=UPI000F5C1F09|nr:hypothetical protein [Staphylospora marina]
MIKVVGATQKKVRQRLRAKASRFTLVIVLIYVVFLTVALVWGPGTFGDAVHAEPQGGDPGGAGKDDMELRYEYMNYLMTTLALIGTIGGIGFTVYGYYQAMKLPELIEKEVEEQLEEQLEEHKEEMDEQIKEYMQSLEILLENALIDPYHERVVKVTRKQDVLDVLERYGELWGVHYYNAIFQYYEAETDEEKWEAFKIMKQHLREHPGHVRAHVFLICWYLTEGALKEAHLTLVDLLDHDPYICYEEQLLSLIEWYGDPDSVRDRNRSLFRAEKRIYEMEKRLHEFRNPDVPTKLEALLERMHTNPDLELDQELLERIQDPAIWMRRHLLPEEMELDETRTA